MRQEEISSVLVSFLGLLKRQTVNREDILHTLNPNEENIQTL